MRNEKLYEPVQHLEQMLNNSSIDAILAIDLEGVIMAWNKTAERFYKKPRQAVTGKQLLDEIPSMQEDAETLEAIRLAKQGTKTFVPATSAYYHRHHAENHFVPLMDESGNIMGVMNLVHDVSHRIKAEEQLQILNEELVKRYRQLKITSDEMASYTSITSHKIKEPITQIYTSIEQLIKLEGSNLGNSSKAAFRKIQSSLNRMNLLLDDVLNLSQISILRKPEEMVDLNSVIEEVVAEWRQRNQGREANVIFSKLSSVTAHRDYLKLLFYQLIDNAIKFNEHPVPTVKMSCEHVTVDDGAHHVYASDYIRIGIHDDGIGIEETERENIFNMFTKLHDKKFKGSGMGLTLARKIMDVHEGFIVNEKGEKEGAVFYCYFPV